MSFDQAFALTVSPSVEGGYACTSSDPGNWSGGSIGVGELLGTQYGISAAFLYSLPAADPYARHAPRSLTLSNCAAIYRTHYWDLVQGDDLPASVAGLLFDAAVNQGQGWAGSPPTGRSGRRPWRPCVRRVRKRCMPRSPASATSATGQVTTGPRSGSAGHAA